MTISYVGGSNFSVPNQESYLEVYPVGTSVGDFLVAVSRSPESDVGVVPPTAVNTGGWKLLAIVGVQGLSQAYRVYVKEVKSGDTLGSWYCAATFGTGLVSIAAFRGTLGAVRLDEYVESSSQNSVPVYTTYKEGLNVHLQISSNASSTSISSFTSVHGYSNWLNVLTKSVSDIPSGAYSYTSSNSGYFGVISLRLYEGEEKPISYVSHTLPQSVFSGSGINEPAFVFAGDLIIASVFCEFYETSEDVTAPVGWAKAFSSVDYSSYLGRWFYRGCFYKISTGGASVTSPWTSSGGTTITIGMVCYRSKSGVISFDVVQSPYNNDYNTTITYNPSVTLPKEGVLVSALAGRYNSLPGITRGFFSDNLTPTTGVLSLSQPSVAINQYAVAYNFRVYSELPSNNPPPFFRHNF